MNKSYNISLKHVGRKWDRYPPPKEAKFPTPGATNSGEGIKT